LTTGRVGIAGGFFERVESFNRDRSDARGTDAAHLYEHEPRWTVDSSDESPEERTGGGDNFQRRKEKEQRLGELADESERSG
jgi:hypothetical protein